MFPIIRNLFTYVADVEGACKNKNYFDGIFPYPGTLPLVTGLHASPPRGVGCGRFAIERDHRRENSDVVVQTDKLMTCLPRSALRSAKKS